MYRIVSSDALPGKKLLCQIGYPEHLVPDLCFYSTDNEFSNLTINSTVLKEALLNSKDFLLFELGLKVEEIKGRKVK